MAQQPLVPSDWRKISDWLKSHPTESSTNFTYGGWADFIKDVVIESPEIMLQKAIVELQTNFDKMILPHSPITPEEAASRAIEWEVGANVTYLAVMAGCIAAEAVGLGQMETPTHLALANPALSSLMDAAKGVRMAYFDSTFIEGVRYKAKADHMPTVLPASTLVDAHVMGIIPTDLYLAQMRYHGYTSERSILMSDTNIRMPDIQTILELARRGVLSDLGATDWLLLNKVPIGTIDGLLALKTNIPEPYRIADFASKNLLNTDELHSSMNWYGIGSYFADKWKQSLEQQPTFEQLITMVRRGLIDNDWYMNTMMRTGVSVLNAAKLLALKDVIPPVGDLIRFAVREAFPVDPGEAQFREVQKYAAQQGLSPFWVDKYWLAHFTRMSLTTAYQNLWRGIFDKGAFEYYLLINDIHPDDWDSIEAVAYQPPNTRELGYGYDVGVYTEEDITTYRKWGGLSEADAKKAAKSLVLYRTETERNQVRTAAMNLYTIDKMTVDQFKAVLKETQTNDATAQLWIKRADYIHELKKKPETDTEGRIVSSSEAVSAFKLKLRDETWLKAALKELAWTDERIAVVVEKAKAEMTEEEAKAAIVKYRDVTVAQLKDMYDLKLIDDTVFYGELLKLGYREEDAALLIDIYTHVEEKPVVVKHYTEGDISALYDLFLADETDIRDTYLLEGYDETHAELLTRLTVVQVLVPNLKARYSKGWIDQNELYSGIVGAGVPSDRANLLMEEIVKNEQGNRVAAEKDLTKAEILKGYKNKVIDTAQSMELLMDLGYSEDEAYYLLVINTVAAAGDPEGYLDMKRATEAYKKALGKESVNITQDMIDLQKKIKEVQAELDRQRKIGANEVEIAKFAAELSGLKIRLKQLLTEAKKS